MRAPAARLRHALSLNNARRAISRRQRPAARRLQRRTRCARGHSSWRAATFKVAHSPDRPASRPGAYLASRLIGSHVFLLEFLPIARPAPCRRLPDFRSAAGICAPKWRPGALKLVAPSCRRLLAAPAQPTRSANCSRCGMHDHLLRPRPGIQSGSGGSGSERVKSILRRPQSGANPASEHSSKTAIPISNRIQLQCRPVNDRANLDHFVSSLVPEPQVATSVRRGEKLRKFFPREPR